MEEKKEKYEAPLVKIRLLLVEDGFAISSDLEGFSDVENFVPGVSGDDIVNW